MVVKSYRGKMGAFSVDFPELYRRLGDKVYGMKFVVRNRVKNHMLLEAPFAGDNKVMKPVMIPLDFYRSIANGEERTAINGSELMPLLKNSRVAEGEEYEGEKDFMTLRQAYKNYNNKKRHFGVLLVEMTSDYSKFQIFSPLTNNINNSIMGYIIASRHFTDTRFDGLEIGAQIELSSLLSGYEKHPVDENRRLEEIMKKLRVA